MTRPIAAGDELLCPHCRRWHPLVKRHDELTPYTQAMLYFDCRGWYYSGQDWAVEHASTGAKDPNQRTTSFNVSSPASRAAIREN
jgi:hypothetical protein